MKIEKATVAIVIVCAVIVALSTIAALSTRPSFCSTCHRKEYTAWQKSEHRDVPCSLCHARAGFAELSAQRIRTVRMIAASATGLYRKPVVTRVASESCRMCHLDAMTTTKRVGAIRISHKELEDDYKCADCHSTVVHGNSVPSPRVARMEQCLSCHNKSETAKCETCHVPGVEQARVAYASSWRVTHGQNWRKTHGMGDLRTCQACHVRGSCSRCHKVDMPHPGAWLNIHSKEAEAAPEACAQCHPTTMCTNCHGLELPHPASFLPKHKDLLEQKGEDLCLTCHLERGCEKCHATHAHPGIPQERVLRLRKQIGLD